MSLVQLVLTKSESGPILSWGRNYMAIPRRLPMTLDPKGASGPALRAFFRIAERWKLGSSEQRTLLGVSARSTFFKWKKDLDGRLSLDTLERISYLLGIFKALHVLLPDAEAADSWIKRPNTASLFGGKSALDRMLSGRVSDLYVVRQYLDGQRAGA